MMMTTSSAILIQPPSNNTILQICDFTNVNSAIDVITILMQTVERVCDPKITGSQKSRLVVDILTEILKSPELLSKFSASVRHDMQILVWSSNDLLQSTMNIIVDAAKGHLSTDFNGGIYEDSANIKHTSSTVHRWTSTLFGY
jgi:hypothetical protein